MFDCPILPGSWKPVALLVIHPLPDSLDHKKKLDKLLSIQKKMHDFVIKESEVQSAKD